LEKTGWGQATQAQIAQKLGVLPSRVWQMSRLVIMGLVTQFLKQPKARKKSQAFLHPEEEPAKLKKRIAFLGNLERGVLGKVKPLGRPTTSPSKRFQGCLKVARELKKKGLVNWRPVFTMVGPVGPTRNVQKSVNELKRRHGSKTTQMFGIKEGGS